MDLTINISEREPIAGRILRAAMALLRGEAEVDTPPSAEREYLETIEAHGPLISRVCYYYSRSLQDYEDLRQDCLINIWRGLPRFDRRSSTATWLYRVCINTCITSWRGGRHAPRTVPLQEADRIDDTGARERDERIDRLYTLISMLPLVDRGIIMMWLDGHDYEEIAETTGLTKSNVAVRLHRIRKRLKALSTAEL